MVLFCRRLHSRNCWRTRLGLLSSCINMVSSFFSVKIALQRPSYLGIQLLTETARQDIYRLMVVKNFSAYCTLAVSFYVAMEHRIVTLSCLWVIKSVQPSARGSKGQFSKALDRIPRVNFTDDQASLSRHLWLFWKNWLNDLCIHKWEHASCQVYRFIV